MVFIPDMKCVGGSFHGASTGGIAPPPAGALLVQQAAATDSGGITQIVFPGPLTPGNSLILVLSCAGTTGNDFSFVYSLNPSGALVTAMAVDVKNGTNGHRIGIFYLHNLPAADISIDVSDQNGGQVNGNASEWSGLANAAPETALTSIGSDTAPTTNNATPVSTRNLIIAGTVFTNNVYLTGPSVPFTRLTATGANPIWQEGAYLIQSAATLRFTSWALSITSPWSTGIVSFGAL